MLKENNKMSEKMRFAIIGGGIIAHSHAKAIVGNPRAELVAIADVEIDKANKMAAEYSIPQIYANYEQPLSESYRGQPLFIRDRIHALNCMGRMERLSSTIPASSSESSSISKKRCR